MKEEWNLSDDIIRDRENTDVLLVGSFKEFIKIIEKKVMDYRMYADMYEDEFWATSAISPQEAEKRAKYIEEFFEFIKKQAGKKLI